MTHRVLDEAHGERRGPDGHADRREALRPAQRTPLRLGENERRPVPEVQGVRVPSDPLQWRDCEAGGRRPGQGVRRTADDERHRRHHGDEHRSTGPRDRVVEAHTGDENPEHAGPAEGGPPGRWDRRDPGADNSERRSGEQFAHPGRQQEECPGWPARGPPHGDDEAGDGEDTDHRQHESAVLLGAAGQQHEQERPAQVELLLDRQ